MVVTPHSPALLAGLPVGPGVSPQPAFCSRGVYLPLVSSLALTVQPRPVYLQMVDKLEPPIIPPGYAVTLACLCLLDTTRSLQRLVVDREDRLRQKQGNDGKPLRNGDSNFSTADLDIVPVRLSDSASLEKSPLSSTSATSTNEIKPDDTADEGTVELDELGNAICEINLKDNDVTTVEIGVVNKQIVVPLNDTSATSADSVLTVSSNNNPSPDSRRHGTPSTTSGTPLDSKYVNSSGLVSTTRSLEEEAVLKQLLSSAWCGLLAALSTLLEACTDEAATESILQAFQVCYCNYLAATASCRPSWCIIVTVWLPQHPAGLPGVLL